MKKFFNFLVIFALLFSACTLQIPALFGARIVNVEYQDLENLAVYLRNAEDGYVVKVGEYTFDCSFDEEDPDLLVCLGPAFEPGEDLVIKFFDGEGGEKPLAELTFVAPDIPEELKDGDNDGVPNTEDECPTDPLKSSPGECGCGKVDTDSDGDDTPDCKDEYPNDPTNEGDDPKETEEVDPDEKDTDEDGVPDEEDMCPEDPEKVEEGECGCGTPDTDEDEDGLPDCEDECPDLAYQDTIGDPCDDDEDNDGYKDGGDQCPFDPFKFKSGYCGCGESEKDTDKDGKPDCVDGCPENPDKTKPDENGCEEICGGAEPLDTDGDGTPDCEDGCPEDKKKTEPGECGCGDEEDPVGDPCNHDEDEDTYNDWIDECPYSVNKKHPGDCGCGCPETTFCDDENTDGDWFCNCWDECPGEPGLREYFGCTEWPPPL